MRISNVLARALRTVASAARARADRARESGGPVADDTLRRRVSEKDQSARDRGGAAEPGLPHLEAARDPELMREVFQKHLRPIGDADHRILECRISRVRYQPPSRCTLEYVLILEESGTGRERRQRLTGVMLAEGKSHALWRRLRDTAPKREYPDAFPNFAPLSYVEDLDMLVQVFPYDSQVPALPVLMAGPPPEFEPPLLARFGPGDWRIEGWDADPIRYKPGMRATLKLTARARNAADGQTQERRFYAKTYNERENGEQVHRVLQALWDRAVVREEGFTVGRPVAYSGDLRAVLQEEVSGISLKDMFLRGEEATPAVRRAAGALATLHLDGGLVPQRRRPLRDEVALLEKRGNTLRRAYPRMEAEIGEMLGTIIGGLEEVPPAPVHGDLNLSHIVLDGDRPALLDLDDFVGADPVLDVARLLASLAALPHRSSLPSDRKRAAEAFVEEYFARVPESWRARLPVHYAGALLKIATGFVRGQQRGGSDKIEALLGEARGSLAGRIW